MRRVQDGEGEKEARGGKVRQECGSKWLQSGSSLSLGLSLVCIGRRELASHTNTHLRFWH